MTSPQRPRGNWPRIWAAWGAVVVGSFAILEGWALFTPEGGDTLTEQLQNVLAVAGPWWGAAAIVLGGSWLGWHFLGPDSRVWVWRRERRRPEGLEDES